MSSDSAFSVQAALYARLSADAALTALIGAGHVHDHVPAGSAMPYVVIGDISSRPLSAQVLAGRELDVPVHVYSRADGQREARQILAAVETAVHGVSLPLTGHTTILSLCVGSDVRMAEDGLTRYGTARFRIVTQPVS